MNYEKYFIDVGSKVKLATLTSKVVTLAGSHCTNKTYKRNEMYEYLGMGVIIC
jgi:hypothetical protein